LEIVPIRDAAMLRAGVDVYADSFGIPPASAERVMGEDVLREPALTPYAATREDAVLAVAATSRSGNVLYLDLMATAPAHRRQGIGSALLGHVLAEHAATGATHAFMLASDEGRALYERLGFRVLFEAAIWVVPATVAHTP
jgi:GNAT superfamily N-acetyltransferase